MPFDDIGTPLEDIISSDHGQQVSMFGTDRAEIDALVDRSSIKYAGVISIASAGGVRTSSHLTGARILRAARWPGRRKHSEKVLMRKVRQTNHDFKGDKSYDIPFEAVNVLGFRDFGQGLRSSRN